MNTVSRMSRFMIAIAAVSLSMGVWEIVTPSANSNIGYNDSIYGGGTGDASASVAFNA